MRGIASVVYLLLSERRLAGLNVSLTQDWPSWDLKSAAPTPWGLVKHLSQRLRGVASLTVGGAGPSRAFGTYGLCTLRGIRHGQTVFLSHYNTLSQSLFLPPSSPRRQRWPLIPKSHRLAVRGCCVRNAARARGVRWERHARSQSSHGQRRRRTENFWPRPPEEGGKKKSPRPSRSHGTVRSGALPVPCPHTATK